MEGWKIALIVLGVIVLIALIIGFVMLMTHLGSSTIKGYGASCGSDSDCSSEFQCSNSVCTFNPSNPNQVNSGKTCSTPFVQNGNLCLSTSGFACVSNKSCNKGAACNSNTMTYNYLTPVSGSLDVKTETSTFSLPSGATLLGSSTAGNDLNLVVVYAYSTNQGLYFNISRTGTIGPIVLNSDGSIGVPGTSGVISFTTLNKVIITDGSIAMFMSTTATRGDGMLLVFDFQGNLISTYNSVFNIFVGSLNARPYWLMSNDGVNFYISAVVNNIVSTEGTLVLPVTDVALDTLGWFYYNNNDYMVGSNAARTEMFLVNIQTGAVISGKLSMNVTIESIAFYINKTTVNLFAVITGNNSDYYLSTAMYEDSLSRPSGGSNSVDLMVLPGNITKGTQVNAGQGNKFVYLPENVCQ